MPLRSHANFDVAVSISSDMSTKKLCSTSHIAFALTTGLISNFSTELQVYVFRSSPPRLKKGGNIRLKGKLRGKLSWQLSVPSRARVSKQ